MAARKHAASKARPGGVEVTLTIPGKPGPFYLRKLNLAETMEFMRKASGGEWKEEDLYRHLVQRTLVNGDGRQVYGPKQFDAMEADLGGVKIVTLGMRAHDVNDIDELNSLSSKVEDAQKN